MSHSINFPAQFSWITNSLEAKCRELKEQSGLVIHPNQLAAILLARHLDPKEALPEKKRKSPQSSRSVTVVFTDEDLWLLRAVDRLVEVKRSTGISPSTNRSEELIRLASNGHKRQMVGAQLDRIILDAASESFEE